jgi:hypothetical protein
VTKMVVKMTACVLPANVPNQALTGLPTWRKKAGSRSIDPTIMPTLISIILILFSIVPVYGGCYHLHHDDRINRIPSGVC